jgi:hypothetical protein
MSFFTDIERSVLKLIQKHKRPQVPKQILIRKSNTKGITIPNFKSYNSAIVTKIAWYWHRNRYKHQWNRIETPAIIPHSYSHLILIYRYTGIQNIPWRKEGFFNK